jgi:hypothetical protein
MKVNSKPGTLNWDLARALDEGAASKRLRFLLGCLEPEVQERLTQKIKFKRLATPEDWLAIGGKRPSTGLDNPLLALSDVRLGAPKPGTVMPMADT